MHKLVNQPTVRRPHTLFGLIILLLLIGACSGLAGEPEIVATIRPTETRVPDIGYPLNVPDLTRGAQIYAQNCTRCHGLTGAGDGEFVLNGDITSIPDFTDPSTARAASPHDWFMTITNGNIETLMPPWAGELSESERWDVTMYVYTLAYSQEQLNIGQAVWLTECADCHGETGLGDGPRAAEIPRPVSDLTTQSQIVTVSDSAYFNITTEGQGEHMPAFADTLTTDERWAVTAYLRTLTLANPATVAQPPPTTTEESGTSAAGEPGTVTGTITNGTSIGTVPEGMTVMLRYGNENGIQDLSTTLNPDGTFRFTDVPINEDMAYITYVNYRDRTFTSEPARGDLENPSFNLPITIYELTEDSSVINIIGTAIQITADAQALSVLQVIRFSNSSDRMYTTSSRLDDGRFVSLIIPLPVASVLVSTDTEQRYAYSNEEATIVDTYPVLPGREHIIELVYLIPYTDGAFIDYPLNYRLQGPVRLLFPDDALSVRSEQLPPLGEEVIGETTYNTYGAELDLQPGETILFEVRGEAPNARRQPASDEVSGSTVIFIIMVGLGLLALFFAGFIYIQQNRRGGQQRNRHINNLIRQIAELDEMHEAGQINHDVYQRQRQQFKTMLEDLMNDDKARE